MDALAVFLTVVLEVMAGLDGGPPRSADFFAQLAQAPDQAPIRGVLLPFTVESGSVYRASTLCQLMATAATGGKYRVEELKSTLEIDDSGIERPFTYVTLKRLEAWDKDAPDVVVARMRGGATRTPGKSRTSPISLILGDSFGYLLHFPDGNRGYPAMGPLWVFREEEMGYSNGQLFTSPVWSEEWVKYWLQTNFAASPACPLEMKPGEDGAQE